MLISETFTICMCGCVYVFAIDNYLRTWNEALQQPVKQVILLFGFYTAPAIDVANEQHY